MPKIIIEELKMKEKGAIEEWKDKGVSEDERKKNPRLLEQLDYR